MKTTALYNINRPGKSHVAYPNSASRRQIVNRIVDLLLMAASGAGIAAMVLFMLALA